MSNNFIDDVISILQEHGDSDIVKADVVNKLNEFMKMKNAVLDIHTIAITVPKDDKSRWSTYVKGDNNQRIKITSTTEKGLYEKLYNFYFGRDIVTISSLFDEWINLRSTIGVSSRTVARHINHFDKYYRTNKIVNVPIQKVDSRMIETFLQNSIIDFQLTKKEYANMKYIIADIMKYAFRHKIIQYNPMLDVEVITLACKPQNKYNDSSRYYTPDEQKKMFQALNNELAKYPTKTQVYAIFLLFKLGLRVGEVVALKWSDIDFIDREIHINRMESREYDESKKLVPIVVEHTKKKSDSGNRFLPLSDYEISIFNTIKAINLKNSFYYNDFIFCNSCKRTTIASIDRLIRKCCDNANIEEKSAHDIRRTVASEMYMNNIPLVSIQKYLGHSDPETTWGYIYDIVDKQERSNKIIASLNDLNGLERTQAYSNII